jgi:hypothetical protein
MKAIDRNTADSTIALPTSAPVIPDLLWPFASRPSADCASVNITAHQSARCALVRGTMFLPGPLILGGMRGRKKVRTLFVVMVLLDSLDATVKPVLLFARPRREEENVGRLIQDVISKRDAPQPVEGDRLPV